MPLFARRFLLDFIETGLGLLFALTLAFPTTVADGKAVAIAIGGAVLSALISAGRRAVPGLLAYLQGALQVPDAIPVSTEEDFSPLDKSQRAELEFGNLPEIADNGAYGALADLPADET